MLRVRTYHSDESFEAGANGMRAEGYAVHSWQPVITMAHPKDAAPHPCTFFVVLYQQISVAPSEPVRKPIGCK